MRLNLGCGSDIRAQGYLNIDVKPNSDYPAETYRQGDARSLDWICDDGTVEEILAMHILACLPVGAVQQAIQNWTSKLQSNGVLKISVFDIYATAEMLVNNLMSTHDFIISTFGKQEQGDCYLSAMDAQTLCRLLEECGLTIELKRYDGLAFYVEARKQGE